MAVTLTAAQLRAVANTRAPLADKIADSFNKLAPAFALTTPLRIAHFLAQVSHESGGFQFVKELWGPTPAQKRYEGRTDLGNTQPGDGSKFRGHGLIQVTGRANHAEFTAWIKRRYPEAPDFVAEPEALAEFPWALMSAFWFWDTRGLNALADKDDVVAVTRKVNGGTNGLAERKAALKRAKAALGEALAPIVAPKARKPAMARPAPSEPPSDDEAQPEFAIRGAQERLIALGYHDVGLVDGKKGKKFASAIRQLQERAAALGDRVAVDGLYGPETRALLDEKHGDRYRNVVSDERKSITATDLARTGTPGVVTGRRIQWASLLGALTSLVGAAYSAWQAPAELPVGSSIALAFLPPWVAAVAPFLFTFLPLAYTTLAGSGLVSTSVERVREGIDNSGAPPANPGPGGLFGSLFGGR